MKIAVIGANGQLGTDVARAFTNNGDEVFALTHEVIEVANLESVSGKLLELRPDIVVNTTAMHHVENCEREPERAYAVNALGPRNLAVVADELHAVLVHVSTDYVFDGNTGTSYI